MLPDYEIVSGRGIGRIILGLSKKEIADIMGAPDEIEHPENPDNESCEIFCYNAINCSLLFDPDQDDRLVEISIENGYFHLARKIRVGLRKEDLLNFGTALRFGEYRIEESPTLEYPAQELISYEQAGLHFWLNNGIITAIGITPLVAEDGRIIWPEPEGDEI
ncbi:MAG: hypothetical protein NTW10_08750 [Bacteroidetes bacterium]|nr:hypothetical protein [Bacteroidota bacterium]